MPRRTPEHYSIENSSPVRILSIITRTYIYTYNIADEKLFIVSNDNDTIVFKMSTFFWPAKLLFANLLERCGTTS